MDRVHACIVIKMDTWSSVPLNVASERPIARWEIVSKVYVEKIQG
jgi:hypothetical protein